MRFSPCAAQTQFVFYLFILSSPFQAIKEQDGATREWSSTDNTDNTSTTGAVAGAGDGTGWRRPAQSQAHSETEGLRPSLFPQPPSASQSQSATERSDRRQAAGASASGSGGGGGEGLGPSPMKVCKMDQQDFTQDQYGYGYGVGAADSTYTSFEVGWSLE